MIVKLFFWSDSPFRIPHWGKVKLFVRRGIFLFEAAQLSDAFCRPVGIPLADARARGCGRCAELGALSSEALSEPEPGPPPRGSSPPSSLGAAMPSDAVSQRQVSVQSVSAQHALMVYCVYAVRSHPCHLPPRLTS